MHCQCCVSKKVFITAYLVDREVECFPPNVLHQGNLLNFLHNGRHGVLLLSPIHGKGQAKEESSDPGKEVTVQVNSDQSQSHDGLHSLDHRVWLFLLLLHVSSKLIEVPGMVVWVCWAHLMERQSVQGEGGGRGDMEVGEGTWRWEREHGGGRGNMEVGEGTWR